MAVRLQSQQSGKGYPSAQQKPLSDLVSQQEFDALLSTHVIELELLGVCPRLVSRPARRFDVPVLIGLTVWGYQGVALWNGFRSGTVPISYLIGFHLLLALLAYFAATATFPEMLRTRKGKRLLEHGAAVPAVVRHVETRFQRSLVRFTYRDTTGRERTDTVTVPTAIRSFSDLQATRTFTVLVSPKDGTVVLPYFFAGDFRVEGIRATLVSLDVSARLAAQAQQSYLRNVQPLGAIEPELCRAAPRNVRKTTTAQRADTRNGFTIAVLGTLLCLILRLEVGLYPGFLLVFLGLLLSPLLMHFSDFANAPEQNLLQNGTPVRAIVMRVSLPETDGTDTINEQVLTFSYKFETADGLYRFGTVSITQKRAWQLGVGIGSTFTVLYDPGEPDESIPYFQIKNREIVGGIGAMIG